MYKRQAYYEYDYEGGVQERIVITNRQIVDQWFGQLFTKEFVKENLNISSNLPSNSELRLHLQSEFISDLFGVNYIIDNQSNLLKGVLESNSKLRILIRNNIK